MGLIFKNERIVIDRTHGMIQHEPRTVAFNSDVINADVALKGFLIRYYGDDHHVRDIEVSIKDALFHDNPKSLTFEIEFLLRDNSGNMDDDFGGWVDVLVIAESVTSFDRTKVSTSTTQKIIK